MIIKNFNLKKTFFTKNAQGIRKIYHDVLLLMKFLQTKPQVKNFNFKFYDLIYTPSKNRIDKEIVIDEYESNENDYINYEDFFIPNHNISFEPRETKMK